MATLPPSNPDWFMLGMGLFGGLALFLYGLDQLSEGLKHAAGDALKTLLTRLTSNRFHSALTGAVVTGILNSSSVPPSSWWDLSLRASCRWRSRSRSSWGRTSAAP